MVGKCLTDWPFAFYVKHSNVTAQPKDFLFFRHSRALDLQTGFRSLGRTSIFKQGGWMDG